MDSSTLGFYNANFLNYAKSTVNLDVAEVRDSFVNHVLKHKQSMTTLSILDAGCGSGRDSLAFKNMNFDVEAFDGSAELVAFATAYSGVSVRHLTFDNIPSFSKSFDGVWCMASLLHLDDLTLLNALNSLSSNHLNSTGVLFASFKSADHHHSAYDDKGRFFNYHTVDSLNSIFSLLNHAFKTLTFSYNIDSMGRNDTQWINVLACKA